MGRSISPQPDPRLNDTIEQTLKDYGVFHAGISCTVDTVEIVENDLINNRSKLSYTITIKNNDEFNLYVFDPLKMGDAYFHYYHNGIYLRGKDNLYQSTTGSQIPGSGENPLNWLIKLNSKDSITRTLQKTGYPYIPKGNYSCGFNFDGLNSIAKSTREQPDGRIWIGRVTATDSIKFN